MPSFKVIVGYKALDPSDFNDFESFIEAGFANDGSIEAAAGRKSDFAGSDSKTRDIGWWVETADEADTLHRRILDRYEGLPGISVRVRETSSP